MIEEWVERGLIIVMAVIVGIYGGVLGYSYMNVKTLTRIETLEKTCRNVN